MSWECPKCGSDDLTVVVETEARLHQYGEDNFETEITGDHEWDDKARMDCQGCGHSGDSWTFEVPQ